MRIVPEASNTKKGKLTFGIKLLWREVALDLDAVTGNDDDDDDDDCTNDDDGDVDNDDFDPSISLLLEILLLLLFFSLIVSVITCPANLVIIQWASKWCTVYL